MGYSELPNIKYRKPGIPLKAKQFKVKPLVVSPSASLIVSAYETAFIQYKTEIFHVSEQVLY